VTDRPATQLAEQALERLRSLGPHGGAPFSSDLSVSEMVLVDEAGFDPLGLVAGSCVFHVGYSQWPMAGNSLELWVLSKAMSDARTLAMHRMEREAQQLGAAGVVGVRIEIDFEHWGEGLAEFVALGTAVRPRTKVAPGRPFTSDLSGQDFYVLLQAGYRPLGLVMGVCVWHVPRQSLARWLTGQGQNYELDNFTESFYRARELAMARMQHEAERLGAEGIVGVRIQEASHSWGSHTIEFLALGTAIGSVGGSPPAPDLVLPLDDAPS
jgi:uncharacterized protein YbjQ (UPF0145 family)